MYHFVPKIYKAYRLELGERERERETDRQTDLKHVINALKHAIVNQFEAVEKQELQIGTI